MQNIYTFNNNLKDWNGCLELIDFLFYSKGHMEKLVTFTIKKKEVKKYLAFDDLMRCIYINIFTMYKYLYCNNLLKLLNTERQKLWFGLLSAKWLKM